MGNCHARCEPGESGENCKASSDRYLSVLKITSDGRKLGLDQRIINPMLPDEPGTKVNQCVDNILQIWRDGHPAGVLRYFHTPGGWLQKGG